MIYETGAGVTDADSYAQTATTTTFHADRGNAAWAAATTAQQSSALIRATDYLEASYSANAEPLTATQGLQWPIAGSTSVPKAVRQATMILALEALAGPLTGRVDRGVKAVSESVDGIVSLSTTYEDNAPGDPFPHLTNLLRGVATRNGAGGGGWGGRTVR